MNLTKKKDNYEQIKQNFQMFLNLAVTPNGWSVLARYNVVGMEAMRSLHALSRRTTSRIKCLVWFLLLLEQLKTYK